LDNDIGAVNTRKPSSGERRREAVRAVERGRSTGERAKKLAQLGPDVAPERFQPVDLAEIVREVVGNMAYRARTLGIDLGAEASAPAPMAGAKAELRSLITNLVDNALRYAPRDSEVTVKVIRDAAGIRMTVLDAGPGIPAEVLPRIFDPFFTTKPPGEGSGLGLSVSYGIITELGGRLRAENRPEGGAAFVLELPAGDSL